jgi:hypothetical protein
MTNCGRVNHSSFGNSFFGFPMSGPAQVRSTQAIDALQASLARFQQRVQAALDALDAEIRRAADWVEHDRPSHWRNATHDAEDAVHQAKIELERCLLFSLAGERPACREQKAALKAAQARLAYCREKGDMVKRWQRNFRHESFEYDGRVGQLRRMLEHDVPKARAVLMKILRRLEEYQIERPPEAFELPAESLPTVVEPAARTAGAPAQNGNSRDPRPAESAESDDAESQ